MTAIATGSLVKLRLKSWSDASNDYRWRVDPELSRLDAVSPLTLPFEMYLKGYAVELSLFGSTGSVFGVETLDGQHIGNCAYFDLDEENKEVEIGVMIGERDYWDKGYGTDVVTTLLQYLFDETNVERIYLRTLDWNRRAKNCFQKCGFLSCGCVTRGEYNFVLMDISRSRFKSIARVCKATESSH